MIRVLIKLYMAGPVFHHFFFWLPKIIKSSEKSAEVFGSLFYSFKMYILGGIGHHETSWRDFFLIFPIYRNTFSLILFYFYFTPLWFNSKIIRGCPLWLRGVSQFKVLVCTYVRMWWTFSKNHVRKSSPWLLFYRTPLLYLVVRGWSSHHFLLGFFYIKKKVGNFCEKPFLGIFVGRRYVQKANKSFYTEKPPWGVSSSPQGTRFSL